MMWMRALAAGWLMMIVMPALADVEPVTGFDLDRYLGTWHEIASIPTSFQEDCVYATRAMYGHDPRGRLRVENSCQTAAGETIRVKGVARFAGPDDEAHLEVTFVRLLEAPLWFAGGDYVVIALDEDYRWSAVADPSTSFAWILAREPELNLDTLMSLKPVYEAAGYDTCNILTSRHVRNDVRQPLCTLSADTD
ncbi:MAG: lipocalin family protein [Pseudomonadota bacterium]